MQALSVLGPTSSQHFRTYRTDIPLRLGGQSFGLPFNGQGEQERPTHGLAQGSGADVGQYGSRHNLYQSDSLSGIRQAPAGQLSAQPSLDFSQGYQSKSGDSMRRFAAPGQPFRAPGQVRCLSHSKNSSLHS